MATHSAQLGILLAKRPDPEPHRLGEEAVRRGYITREQLEACIAIQKTPEGRGKRLGVLLVETGAITRPGLEEALDDILSIPRVALANFDYDMVALYSVPVEVLERHNAVPLMYHNGNLVVASAEPLRADVQEELQFAASRPVILVHATRPEIVRAVSQIQRAHARPEEIKAIFDAIEDFKLIRDDQQLWKEAERLAQQVPLVRMVASFLDDAIAMRASDVHIRPEENAVSLLYRLDGQLVPMREFHRALLPAVVSRIKILAKMNIAERRMPQDGHAQFEHQGASVDLRVSTLPTRYGESIVIRILNKREVIHSIDEIGMTLRDTAALRDLISRSHGLLLVTGPTGSGKTTTIYAALKELLRHPINIVTVEDPIEYEISGIRQIELVPQINFSFPRALRHILRHDPEVVMIGEMRDRETCEIAVQSALTGHLVISSLHTNDAPSAIVRLIDMGVEPYLIRSALVGVLAQRLVRLNCPNCLEAEAVDPYLRERVGLAPDEPFFHGAGCSHCNQSGFLGRTAIYELMPITPDVGDLIVEGVSVHDLRERAVRLGMVPLLDNGLQLARRRQASFSEVYRACS